jgi:hypothetical protein
MKGDVALLVAAHSLEFWRPKKRKSRVAAKSWHNSMVILALLALVEILGMARFLT